MVRNAPPVAGAIYWSRQLLKRIEDPMKIFRDNKAVTSLSDFGRQVGVHEFTDFPPVCLLTLQSVWMYASLPTYDLPASQPACLYLLCLPQLLFSYLSHIAHSKTCLHLNSSKLILQRTYFFVFCSNNSYCPTLPPPRCECTTDWLQLL